MLLLEFFQWWYGKGWAEAAKSSIALLKKVELSFSIGVLLRSLFAPWKRIITPPGRSIDEKFRAMLDNLVSRTVGFFVRIFSLITASILILGAAVIGFVMIISWPLIPVLIAVSAVKGIIG